MSREKMLQAEIALKDEQLADLTNEVERLRRESEESANSAKKTDASELKLAELKQTIGKLAPAAQKTVQCAVELKETHRRLAVVEKEHRELSKNYSVLNGQTTAVKNALAEAKSDARSFDAKRKEAVRRAKKSEAAAKRSARQKLMTIIAAALVCTGTIGGGYAYVRVALAPPAELSDEAATVFKQHAAEYARVVELATQNERDRLNAEREDLAAERNRYEELNENTVWDKIAAYGWLILVFGGGFVVGAMTIFAAFVFRMR